MRLAPSSFRHRNSAPGGSLTPSDVSRAGAPMSDLSALIYELLDAHADTADLAAELLEDPRWGAHLDYLKALQRTGREMLTRECREVRA